MSTVIIIGGTGRAAIRRFEAAQSDPSTYMTETQVSDINQALQKLMDLADEYGCPDDPCPE